MSALIPVRLLQAIDLAAQTVDSSAGLMRYDLLVGADGAGSLVREALVAQVRGIPTPFNFLPCTMLFQGTSYRSSPYQMVPRCLEKTET